MPAQRDVTLTVHNWTGDVDGVRVGDDALTLTGRRGKALRMHRARYDADRRLLTLRFRWDHGDTEIRIN